MSIEWTIDPRIEAERLLAECEGTIQFRTIEEKATYIFRRAFREGYQDCKEDYDIPNSLCGNCNEIYMEEIRVLEEKNERLQKELETLKRQQWLSACPFPRKMVSWSYDPFGKETP